MKETGLFLSLVLVLSACAPQTSGVAAATASATAAPTLTSTLATAALGPTPTATLTLPSLDFCGQTVRRGENVPGIVQEYFKELDLLGLADTVVLEHQVGIRYELWSRSPVTFCLQRNADGSTAHSQTLRGLYTGTQWTSPRLPPGGYTLWVIVGDVRVTSFAVEVVDELPEPTPTPDCPRFWSRLGPNRYAVVVGAPNRVRSEARKGDNIVVMLPAGTVVKVLEGPICADGLVFWRVESESIPGGSGWTAEGDGNEYFLEPSQPPPG